MAKIKLDSAELCKNLATCPKVIFDLRRVAQETIDLIVQVQAELRDRECHYMLMEDGPINGKNEQIRAAQLHEQTAPERARLAELQRVLAQRELLIEHAENQFEAYLAMAKLMAAGP